MRERNHFFKRCHPDKFAYNDRILKLAVSEAELCSCTDSVQYFDRAYRRAHRLLNFD